MSVPDPRSAAEVLRAEIRECRDDLAQVTCQVQALELEHDVQGAAYRIVCGERDEMRRCLVAVLGCSLTDGVRARVKRLLERMTVQH